MRLHYWSMFTSRKNLGDWLSVPILRALGKEPETPEVGRPVLFACGSILHQDHYWVGNPITVWGSGFGAAGQTLQGSRPPEGVELKFLAVRGPLTKKVFDLPETIPMCDPGLLLPDLVKIPDPERSGENLYLRCVGNVSEFIPDHFDDSVSVVVEEEDALQLISRIAHARFVVSESLHGCVIAQAYDVPWAPVFGPDQPWYSKWNGWFQLLGLPSSPDAGMPGDFHAAQKWWDRVGKNGKTPDTRPLLDVFPHRGLLG